LGLYERFRRVAQEQLFGDEANLRVGSIHRSYYPLTQQTLHHAKVTDLRTGAIAAIALDPSGAAVDGEAALQRELQAERDMYGKLDPTLHATLAALADDSEQELPVSIWLYMGPLAPAADRPWFLDHGRYWHQVSPILRPPERPELSKVSAAQVRLDAEPQPMAGQVEAALRDEGLRFQVTVKEAQQSLLDHLAERGWRLDGVSEHLPLVHATLSTAAIRALEQREDVQLIALIQRTQNALDNARLSTYADYAWDVGLNGRDVRIGVIEVGATAAVENPFLWGVVQDSQNGCDTPQDHPTCVTGMVRSRHVRYRGIAYGALVRVGGSCGGWLNQLEEAAERALSWGATVLNNSWGHVDPKGQPDANERYWDALVNQHRATVCFAGGNTGRDYADAFVIHPAMAYNVISVGAYDDHNSTSWSDDSMSPFSSFRDPSSANGDREKPELCAPGSSINSTSVRSPWVRDCGNGTSYSSPMVAGAAALIMQQAPELRAWPEAVKAILMASALNNIEYDWIMEGRDGAGGVDVQEAATKVAKRHTFSAGMLDASVFDAQGDFYIHFHLPIADKARAVIVWSVDPNDSSYPQRPGADLDLYWLDSQGNEITHSESGDNNFEVVGVYDVRPAGTRTLRIHAYRLPVRPVRMAYAVHWWDD